MKQLFSILLVCIISYNSFAQNKIAKLFMSLEMPGDLGKRGAGVAYHPIQKKYYASFAGNETYPFAVFDAKGKRISSDDQTAFADARGIWYNPVSASIEGNGYDTYGWYRYKLDDKGIPVEIQYLTTEMSQPDAQSSGCYNAKLHQVYFYTDAANIHVYNANTRKEVEVVELKLRNGYLPDVYYYSAICNEKGDLGLLNASDMLVDFYNTKTGEYKYTITLPNDAKIADNFSFSYSNGMVWLFDDVTRKWNGYK